MGAEVELWKNLDPNFIIGCRDQRLERIKQRFPVTHHRNLRHFQMIPITAILMVYGDLHV